MPVQVNRRLGLTAQHLVREDHSIWMFHMLKYFAVFCAVTICSGWLAVSFFQWRQDVLYGPYIGGDSDRHRWKS